MSTLEIYEVFTMKTKFWIAILAFLLALCLGLSVLLLMPRQAATYAEITSHGKVIKTVDLRVNQEFTVDHDGGSNTVTVSNGKIAVTEATCPDHYCMHRGFVNSGAQIVCLPNGLVISFVGDMEVDMVVG
jgi:hypothetical protein